MADIPHSRSRRGKVAAARHGVALKRLLSAGGEHELESKKEPAKPAGLRCGASGTYVMDPSEIGDMLMREEIAAYEAAERRSRPARARFRPVSSARNLAGGREGSLPS